MSYIDDPQATDELTAKRDEQRHVVQEEAAFEAMLKPRQEPPEPDFDTMASEIEAFREDQNQKRLELQEAELQEAQDQEALEKFKSERLHGNDPTGANAFGEGEDPMVLAEAKALAASERVTTARKNLGSIAGGLVDAPGDVFQGGVLDIARAARDKTALMGQDLEKKLGIPAADLLEQQTELLRKAKAEAIGIPLVSPVELTMIGQIIDSLPEGDDGVLRQVSKFVSATYLTGLLTAGTRPMIALAQYARSFQATSTAGKLVTPMVKGLPLNINASLAQAWVMAEDENVVNLMNAVGIPVPDWMEYVDSDEENPTFVNLMNNALTTFGVGLIADEVVGGLVAIRALRQLTKKYKAGLTPEDAAKLKLKEAEQTARSQRERLVDLLGDPNEPLLLPAKKTRATQPKNSKGPGKVEDLEDVSDILDDAAESLSGRARWAAFIKDPLSSRFNWARFESADDITRVISDMADAFKSEIDTAVGPRRTHRAIEKDASELDVFDLTVRQRGATNPDLPPLRIEEEQAMRQLHGASGARLEELAIAFHANPSDELLGVAFNKMMSIHREITRQVSAASAQASRRFSAWQIPVKTSGHVLPRDMDELILNAGGTGPSRLMARLISKAAAEGKGAEVIGSFASNLPGLNAVTKHGYKVGEAIKSYYYFAMLSGTTTHIRNAIGGAGHFGMKMAERQFAHMIGTIADPGAVGNVAAGEAMQYAWGGMKGLSDAFRITHIAKLSGDVLTGQMDDMGKVVAQVHDIMDGGVPKVLKTGTSSFGSGKMDDATIGGGLSAEVWGYDPSTNYGRVFSLLDSVLTSTNRGLAASDEVFKTMFFRAEGQALAYRQATAELMSGDIAEGAFGLRVRQLASDPTEAMLNAMTRQAQEGTFTQNIGYGTSAAAWKAVRRMPFIGAVLSPFQTTPYNLGWEALRRSPMGALMPHFIDDIMSKDPARVHQAWSRYLMGNAMTLSMIDLFIDGDRVRVTGDIKPLDGTSYEQNRRLGIENMSIDFATDPSKGFDGGFVSMPFRGMEPLSGHIGIAANVITLLRNDDFEDDDADLSLLAQSMAGGLATQFMSANMLRTWVDFFAAVDDPGNPRTGLVPFMAHAGSVLATPRIASQFAPVNDEFYRETFGFLDEIQARTPGPSKELPVAYDAAGRPRERNPKGWSALFAGVIPRKVEGGTLEPWDKWLAHRGEVWERPSKTKERFRPGVEIKWSKHPHAYSRYVWLQGAGLVDPMNVQEVRDGLRQGVVSKPPAGWRDAPELGGLYKQLAALAEGNHPTMQFHWDNRLLTDEDKLLFARQARTHYRSAAREVLLRVYPDLLADVKQKADRGLTEETAKPNPDRRRINKLQMDF